MKKLLLVLPIALSLAACGSNESKVTDIAETYCQAIKSNNFKDVRDISKSHVLDNRIKMFEGNMAKYSSLFVSQKCNVTNVETNIETDDEASYSVYFGGSKLDSVEVEWDSKQEEFFVVSDAFKFDLKLY